MTKIIASSNLTNWNNESVCSTFEAYDYDEQDEVGYSPLIRQLIEDLGTDITVLDYGCGYGMIARRLAQENIRSIEAVDISEMMINKAMKFPSQESINYQKINPEGLPFADDYFDAVVCTMVFVNIHEREHLVIAIREMYRTLKPGGVLYILEPNPDKTGIPYRTFQTGECGVVYRDGDARTCFLKLRNGDTLKVSNRHWVRRTYEDIMTSVGFIWEVTLCHLTPLVKPEDGGDGVFAPFVRYKAVKPLTT